jgi:chromate transporter
MLLALLDLYISFFQVGLFSFGGGYAALPLIQNQIVTIHHWLTIGEMADVITISQMTPGPIAINAATFVGTRVAGILGSIVATLGIITPSCIIVLTLSYFYFKYKDLHVVQGVLKGIRPVVVSLIATAGLSMVISAFWNDQPFLFELAMFAKTNWIAVFLFSASLFVLMKFKKVNPILVMLGSGAAGLVLYSIF